MKKNIIYLTTLLAAFAMSGYAQSDVEPTTMRIKFDGNSTPVECEHYLEFSSFKPTNDGTGFVLNVNGQTVEYPFEMLKAVTFFNGTPTVTVKANENPDKKGNYYSTFYSSLEAYNIPDGITVYTAEEVNDEYVRLAEIEGDIIPRGEAVLLHSNTTSDMAMTIADFMGEKATGNQFSGVDIETEQGGATHYMLSYGQKGLGLYEMNSTMMLAPNKAFIELSSSTQAKALRFIFPEDVATGISPLPTSPQGEEMIYNISGQRLNRLQHGINIVGGKKILVK